MRRGYPKPVLIEEALYYAYEAKRNSECVPGVGSETYLNILSISPDERCVTLHYLNYGSTLEVMEKQYQAHGSPRDFLLDGVPRVDLSFLGEKQAL